MIDMNTEQTNNSVSISVVYLNERNVDLLSELKYQFEKIVKDYIADRVYAHQFKANLTQLENLNKSLDFLSYPQLSANIYSKFASNFKNYMKDRIYLHQFKSNIETLQVALNNSRDPNILVNNMLKIEDTIDFQASKQCYASLWKLLQDAFEKNESNLINDRIYQHQYKARLEQLTDIENVIQEYQKNYQWHIAQHYKYANVPVEQREEDLSLEKENEINEPMQVLVTTKVPVPHNVSLNAKPQIENQEKKDLSWFKLICLKLFPFLFKKASLNNEESKNTVDNNPLDFHEVVQKAWLEIDYANLTDKSKEQMNHIKSVIDNIDLKTNANLNITLEVKNTVINVLPKLIAIYNSVKDKDSLNDEKENAHMILENSLVAISTYFDTLKEEQIKNDVEDIKVYGEFVKTKYLKAKAGM